MKAERVLTSAHRLILRLAIDNRPGMFSEVARVIGEHGCSLGAIDLVEVTPSLHVREVTVDPPDEQSGELLAAALRRLEGVEVREILDAATVLHRGGKIEVRGRISVRTKDELSLVYTPAVARISNAISKDASRAWELTARGNTVAIVSNGTAVLGLGDIGPLGALPVMEGKALLFRQLAEISAFPLVIEPKDPRAIVDVVAALAPSVGGVNLEDIAAPACFDVERELRRRLDIPVVHDDQHGTAIVVLAAVKNAAAFCERPLETLRVVVLGAGAAGIASARALHRAGVRAITLCDRRGVLSVARTDLDGEKRLVLEEIGSGGREGTLSDALAEANVFIGVSGPGLLSLDAMRRMARPRIVLALANPIPEIDPHVAAREADVIATGRSDFPNQVNNVLAFPGVFRGLLDARARGVPDDMTVAAADALAATVPAELRSADYVLPSVFDPAVVPAVAAAVAAATRRAGLSR